MSNENNKKNIKEFSAGVIIYLVDQSKRKYLVLHYPGGHFDFPKGHLEAGETEKMAALRELQEETGIDKCTLDSEYLEDIVYSFYRGKTKVTKKVTFFLAEASNNKVTISHEHQGYLWLDYASAIEKITFDNARNLLIKAEKHLNKQI